jgi:mono/diheme cytochrome c family protein
MRGLRSVAMVASLITAQVASAQGPMSSTQPDPAAGTATAPPAAAPGAAPGAASGAAGEFDVEKLFAGTCGWCHSDGGRAAGRGPKLMDSPLTDDEIAYRIRKGKQGAMPAFESSFNAEQIKAIIQYTRNLKPAGTSSQ